MKRRNFIRNSVLASGSLFIPSFLKPFELKRNEFSSNPRSLVIIQLSGGNDGLNTVVPFTNDLYYQKRSSIAVPSNEVLKLNDKLGFNPSLASLNEVYNNGWMSIVNSVGYPNPDRSHFRSMDIWHTASNSDEYLSAGWIGKYLDSNCSTCQYSYTAIEVDDTLSLALKGDSRKGIAAKDANQLYKATRDPFFKQIISNYNSDTLNEQNLGYLYKTMIETYSSAEYIYQKSKIYNNNFEYPDTAFAKQLKTISTFINSGLDTRVYYVTLSGFDTHIAQKVQQDRLLKVYADAVAAFLKDLKSKNKLEDVLVMTFSEFGRRVEQNASNGTDHGTANNIFLMGGKLTKTGVFNDAPNLSDLDEGDLKFQIDFRNIYATLLDKWLGVDGSSILNRNFSNIDII